MLFAPADRHLEDGEDLARDKIARVLSNDTFVDDAEAAHEKADSSLEFPSAVLDDSVSGIHCGPGWDYDKIAEFALDESQWLTDSQLRVINPALTDSQLWGRGAKEALGNDAGARDAGRELELLKNAIQKVICDIDSEGDELGAECKVQLPMHLEVRALGTHLLAVRARSAALVESLEDERKLVRCLEDEAVELAEQLADERKQTQLLRSQAADFADERYTYTHIHTCMHIHTHTHIHTHRYAYASNTHTDRQTDRQIQSHEHTHKHTRIFIRIHTHTHTNTHTHTHVHTNTYTYTHTESRTEKHLSRAARTVSYSPRLSASSRSPWSQKSSTPKHLN